MIPSRCILKLIAFSRSSILDACCCAARLLESGETRNFFLYHHRVNQTTIISSHHRCCCCCYFTSSSWASTVLLLWFFFFFPFPFLINNSTMLPVFYRLPPVSCFLAFQFSPNLDMPIRSSSISNTTHDSCRCFSAWASSFWCCYYYYDSWVRVNRALKFLF